MTGAPNPGAIGDLLVGGLMHPAHLAVGMLAGLMMRDWRHATLCALLGGLVVRLLVLIFARSYGASFTTADAAAVLATTLSAVALCLARQVIAPQRG
jgi:hypothetical protein